MHKLNFQLRNQWGTSRTQTLVDEGEVGISTFKEQLLGKIPFSISLIAALIKGKQTATASLKSFS